MSVYEMLAVIVTIWVIAVGTLWVGFVAYTRWRTLKEIGARKARALAQAEAYQATMLGAVSEGVGRVPGDAEEAALEARAVRRMRR
jgi:hypothetical protein